MLCWMLVCLWSCWLLSCYKYVPTCHAFECLGCLVNVRISLCKLRIVFWISMARINYMATLTVSLARTMVSRCPFNVLRILIPMPSVSKANRWLSSKRRLDWPSLSVPLNKRWRWSMVDASKSFPSSFSPEPNPPSSSSRSEFLGTMAVVLLCRRVFVSELCHLALQDDPYIYQISLELFCLGLVKPQFGL